MTVTPATRRALHERAHSCCEACGAAGATNAHHRVNQSQGGGDSLSNLLLLCGSGTMGCHGHVTEHPHDAVARGQTVRGLPGRNPSGVPVLRWSRELGEREWVTLADDGTVEPVWQVAP